MSILPPVVIGSSNLSLAWGEALLHAHGTSPNRLSPIVISVDGFGSSLPEEVPSIRAAVDASLADHRKVSVRGSALTIFPFDMWQRRGKPGCNAFSLFCVHDLLPRLKSLNSRNRLGTYFERMMAYTGAKRGKLFEVNQLEFVINLLRHRRKWPRQSALQMSCFDPAKDHTGQPVRGFPCLQQVSVTHDGERRIALNAYYPTQFIFDRAYGNYLGLCHLGAFIAHETGLRFSRLNCFIGRPELGSVSRKSLSSLVEIVRKAIVDGHESGA